MCTMLVVVGGGGGRDRPGSELLGRDDLGGSDNDSEEEEGIRVRPRFLVCAAGKGILFSKLETLGSLTVEMLNLRYGKAHRRKHGVG